MLKKNLTRETLSKKIYQTLGFSFNLSNKLVNDVFEEILNGLIKNDKVKIASFGTFKKSIKNERVGRNPKTKEEVIISQRAVVKFKASEQLKNKINNE